MIDGVASFLVRYRGLDELDSRILLARVDGDEFFIVTPGADVYIENLAPGSKEIQIFFRRPRDKSLPFGLDRPGVYDFAERPGDGQLDLLIAEA